MSATSAFILSRFDIDEILRQALEAVLRLSGSERGFVALGDPDSRKDPEGDFRHDICVTMSLSGGDPGLEPFTAARELIKESASRRAPAGRGLKVVLPLVLSHAGRSTKLHPPERQHGDEPLEERIGFLGLERGPGAGDYDEATVRALDAAARGYAPLVVGTMAAVRNETDRLSGLLTRGCFFRVLPECLRAAAGASHPLTLMLLDVRRLDAVNRLSGREKGDDLLRLVGRVLQERLRFRDISARCGGDEFIAALSGCDEPAAQVIAQRIRERFEEETRRAALTPVALNIGFAIFPGHGADAGDLYHRAGQALAAAKRLGPWRAIAWREAHAAVKERVDRLEGLLMGDAAEDYAKILTLVDTIAEVNSSADSGELLRKLLDRMLEATDAERALLLRRNDHDELKVALARDRTRSDVDVTRIRYSGKVVERTLVTGEPFCSVTSAEDPSRSFQVLKLRTAIGVPLAGREGALGVVYLDSREEPARYPMPMLMYLSALAQQVTLVLERTRMIEDLDRKRREIEVLNRRLRERVEAQDEQIVAIQSQLDRTRVGAPSAPGVVLPSTGPMREALDIIDSAARTDAPVLLIGETGVGKEILARELHTRSPRGKNVFVAVNCAAIPHALIESELFGHARGAFTGADRDRAGLFETAHGGTLFLDEISATEPGFQVKLLRALQDRAIRRVGESRDRDVDVRIVAAVNVDLAEAIRCGEFREDLFYRLSVFSVRIPPLRERPSDIPALARAILVDACARLESPEKTLDATAIATLAGQPWRGNVRELRNVIERLAATVRTTSIGEADVRAALGSTGPAPVANGGSESAASRAEQLLEEMITTGQTFWEVARAPYLARRLTRDDVRALVILGLSKSGGSYKRASALFNIPPEDHKRFLDFLHNHDIRANLRGAGRAAG